MSLNSGTKIYCNIFCFLYFPHTDTFRIWLLKINFTSRWNRLFKHSNLKRSCSYKGSILAEPSLNDKREAWFIWQPNYFNRSTKAYKAPYTSQLLSSTIIFLLPFTQSFSSKLLNPSFLLLQFGNSLTVWTHKRKLWLEVEKEGCIEKMALWEPRSGSYFR